MNRIAAKRVTAGRVNRPTARAFFCGLFLSAAALPATAQTLQETKDGIEMMAGAAAICADYLQRPEVLEDVRKLGREQLAKVGLSEAEADAFMDDAQKTAMEETSNETQKQVACEMINIPALK